jgi:hypothetical protein
VAIFRTKNRPCCGMRFRVCRWPLSRLRKRAAVPELRRQPQKPHRIRARLHRQTPQRRTRLHLLERNRNRRKNSASPTEPESRLKTARVGGLESCGQTGSGKDEMCRIQRPGCRPETRASGKAGSPLGIRAGRFSAETSAQVFPGARWPRDYPAR